METRVDEIAAGIYRLSTWVPDVAPPAGFVFNQFLIDAEEPLLFHTGTRALFPLVSAAAASVVSMDRLRWIAFGHVEADECGSMNEWLAAAPRAEVAHGGVGVAVQIADLADRPPVPLTDGQVLDLGGKRVRHIDTPHVPHAWEARVLFEETTGTLLCGDLFTQLGDVVTTDDDILEGAVQGEDIFHASSLAPSSGATVRALADLAPSTLALMHGPSFNGDCTAALHALAEDYDRRVAEAMALVS
jgi:flavorubredoxin